VVITVCGAALSAWAITPREPVIAAPAAIAPTRARRDIAPPSVRPLLTRRVMDDPPFELMPILSRRQSSIDPMVRA